MSTLQTTILKHPDSASNQVTFTAGGDINFDSGVVFIDSSNNRVGIGTTGPADYGANLAVANTSGNSKITIAASSSSVSSLAFADGTASGAQRAAGFINLNHSDNSLQFGVADDAKMQIDSSGRLLIGGTSSQAQFGSQSFLQLQGTGFADSSIALRRDQDNSNPPGLIFAKSRSASIGGDTIVQDGDSIGTLAFAAADGNDVTSLAAQIKVKIDGTPGSNNVPGRFEFSTTADGASSPTERMRISSDGAFSQFMASHTLITTLYHGFVTDNTSSGTATFDAVFTLPDNNIYMIVDIVGYHPLYSGQQEYYRFVATHRTNSNLYETNILDDLRGTGSIAQTNTSITFTGRRPRSNVGTSINSIIKIICRSQLAPTSVAISDS